MKTIFSNKAQKVEKSKLNDFRQGALLPANELQLRIATACNSNTLEQQTSLSTVEERKFFSQVIHTVFSLFLLPALYLKITNHLTNLHNKLPKELLPHKKYCVKPVP